MALYKGFFYCILNLNASKPVCQVYCTIHNSSLHTNKKYIREKKYVLQYDLNLQLCQSYLQTEDCMETSFALISVSVRKSQN